MFGFTNDPEFVYAVYTIQNYHAVCLLLGQIPMGTLSSTGTYCLLGDGIIKHSWHDGAFSHGTAYYRIDNRPTLSVVDCWALEYGDNFVEQYFYSTTSDNYYESPSAFRSVSLSFIQKVNAKYGDPLTIQYTPVS